MKLKRKIEKTIFMSKKLVKDIKRDKNIYRLSEDLHSDKLGEYYFLIDEQELLRGHSQDYHFDKKGIPIIPTYIDVEVRKLIYYPISIGQYGLAIYHTFLRTRSTKDCERFMNIVDWFFENRQTDAKLGDYWLTDVPKPEYEIFYPWPSAFSQSRAISILLRGYQLTEQQKYRDVACNALKIFKIRASEGGVTTFTEFGPFYEEYPASFPTMVLDGMFFSLCGIYDYIRTDKDNALAMELFNDGIRCLKQVLPKYEMGFWIRYNLCQAPFYPKVDPATIGYLRLVITQLKLFFQVTGEPVFESYIYKWQAYDRLFNILRMYRHKYQALKKMNRL
jgi:hypothetical protein